nr:hypothetical protein [Blastomonas sp. AAP53]
MKYIAALAAAMMVLSASSAPAQAMASASASEASRTAPFVAADFDVPTLVTTSSFKVVPLGPDLVKVDFDAYMSSIEHLQKTFTRSTSWPHPGVADADAMKDMQTEQGRFERRESFAYAVLTPDGKRERGCVYVYPSEIEGYDAVVTMWVTKAEYDAGFDAELYAWAKDWVAKEWPFKRVAYPGRSIDWDTWDAMTAAQKAKGAQGS